MCRAIVFQSASGERVEVKPAAVQELRAHAQYERGSKEDGGILIGRRILDSPDVVVDCITFAFPTDRQSSLSFVRNPRGHQEMLDRAWEDSGGVATYLGEWHTHPTPNAAPSGVDLRNCAELSLRSPEPLVFLIVGTERIGCWGHGGQWQQEGL